MAGKKGRGGAGNPFTPTDAQRKQVEAMSAYGIPQADIARVLDVSEPTLRAHFRDELDTGSTKASARVAESLFKKATGDGPQAVTAAIFWAKTRMGWRETVVNEHTGKDGAAIKHEIGADAAFAELVGALGSVARGQASRAVSAGGVVEPGKAGTDKP
jgi:hypothetical protein